MAFENYELCNFYKKDNYKKLVKLLNKRKDVESAYIKKENSYIIIQTKENEIGIDLLNELINKVDKNGYAKVIEQKEVYRGVVYLKGLDCANCASKIEQLGERMLDHEKILVDFATTRFMIETTNKEIIDHLIEKVSVIAHIVDPNIVVQTNKVIDKEVEKAKKNYSVPKMILIYAGFGCFALAECFKHINQIIWLSIIFYSLAFICTGQKVIRMFFKNLFNGRIFDENFLMTIAGIGAFATGHYFEAIMVMILYQIGEELQNNAVNKSRDAISELLTMKASTAMLKVGAEITEVDADTVLPGDIVIVEPNQMIPLDGVIVKGITHLDLKSLTGESIPVPVKEGFEVLSGSINLTEPIEVKVSKPSSESMVNKILEMVETATENKAKSESFISKFAKIYTPIVVGIALILAAVIPTLIILLDKNINDYSKLWPLYSGWIERAMVLLVISCPCSVVISVPLTFFTGIGLSSKKGILIKGSNYLETLSKTENVVFDKTGTLTKGTFKVLEVIPAEGITNESLIQTMAYAEFYSKHPLGICILNEYGRDKVFPDIISNFRRIEGSGISVDINGSEVIIGNRKLIKEKYPDIEPVFKNGITLYCIKGNKYLGCVVFGDILKEEAHHAISLLKEQRMSRIVMLTGDHKTAGYYTANQLSIDEVYTDLLPDNKVDIVKNIISKSKGKTVYVGDGVNDAPVIAVSDVGVAMGSAGADSTIQVADVVIMSDNLTKVSEMIHIAKKTRNKVIENIVFSLLFKIIVLILDLIPSISVPLWLAVFSDVGVCLLTILNTMRLHIQLNKKKHADDCDCDECIEHHEGEHNHD